MSRIDDLIAQHCPRGVEYKPLGDIVKNLDSQRRPVTRSDRSAGQYPYYGANGVQDFVDGYLFDGTFLLVGEDGSVVQPDGAPVVNWAEGKIWVNNHAHVLASNGDGCDLRFLYFFLSTINVRPYVTGGTQPKLNQGNLNKIPVPVPPIEVQREIVRILDHFTELEAELEARRRQYHHYRQTLLTFGSDVQRVPLGKVLNLRAGKFIAASDISPVQNDGNPFPCYGGNGIRGFVERASHQGAFALIGRQGALCGNVKRIRGRFYATEHAVVVRPSDGINIDWAFHLLDFMNLNQYATKSAQPGLAVGTLDGISIPVPPLEEQERVANILDSLDALVNDLSIGLPAELAARRKQYEHYRDRLLTFKELPA